MENKDSNHSDNLNSSKSIVKKVCSQTKPPEFKLIHFFQLIQV